jgi:hypothetical protein
MPLTTISGEIQAQPLNDNFSYLESEKLGNIVYNVTDINYNAVGDGTTDDTLPIQAAINDAESLGGGIIFLPPEFTFLITGTLEISGNNITLTGGGFIKQGFTGAGCILITTAATNISIKGINFIFSSSLTDSGPFLANQGTKVKITENTLNTSIGMGIWNGGCYDTVIANNVIVGSGLKAGCDGIHVAAGAQRVEIVGNQIYNTGDDCISVVYYAADSASPQYVNIAGNNCIDGNARGVNVSNAKHITISGNYIESSIGFGINIDNWDRTDMAENISIIGNTIRNTGTNGIMLNSLKNSIVKGNIIENPSSNCIGIATFDNLKIIENTMVDAPSRMIALSTDGATGTRSQLEIINNYGDTCTNDAIYLFPDASYPITNCIIAKNLWRNVFTASLTGRWGYARYVNGLKVVDNISLINTGLFTIDATCPTPVDQLNNSYA